MIGLFFEVQPRQGHFDAYFEIAGALRQELEKNPGVMFIDRYESLDRPGLILSHSLWRDEAHLVKWRANSKHYKAQLSGRNQHFEGYRLRIGARCFHQDKDGQTETEFTAPYNDPDITPERFAAALYIKADKIAGLDAGECFKSVYRDNEWLMLLKPGSLALGRAAIESACSSSDAYAGGLFLVSRDYGMNEREEAPQFMV